MALTTPPCRALFWQLPSSSIDGALRTVMRNVMHTLFYAITLLLFPLFAISAQEVTVVETSFKVFGNCGMCKTRIEKALRIKEVKMAKWDKHSKILAVAYVSPSITVDSLKQRIAAVGHDTDKFKANDAVYEELPACCLYRDVENTH